MAPQRAGVEVRILERAGGRHITYDVSGAPDGVPVFYQHGTGDSRLCRHPDDAVTAAAGVQLITADRPGGGGSSRFNGARILDRVCDVIAVVDALEIETFVVARHSGGAPHALAIAAAVPHRVSAVGPACAGHYGVYGRWRRFLADVTGRQ